MPPIYTKAGRASMYNPDAGEWQWVNADDVQAALAAGWLGETESEYRRRKEFEEYDAPVTAAALGAARAATLGLSDVVAEGFGFGDDVAKIREYNPITSGAGEVAGVLAPTGAVGFAGRLGAKVAGRVIGGAGLVSRAARTAAQAGVEGAAMGAGGEVSRSALAGDDLTFRGLAESMAKTAVAGAAIGGALHVTAAGVSAAAKKIHQRAVSSTSRARKVADQIAKEKASLEQSAQYLERTPQQVTSGALTNSDISIMLEARYAQKTALRKTPAKMERAREGARAIREHPDDIVAMVARDELKPGSIPGLGERGIENVKEIIKEGRAWKGSKHWRDHYRSYLDEEIAAKTIKLAEFEKAALDGPIKQLLHNRLTQVVGGGALGGVGGAIAAPLISSAIERVLPSVKKAAASLGPAAMAKTGDVASRSIRAIAAGILSPSDFRDVAAQVNSMSPTAVSTAVQMAAQDGIPQQIVEGVAAEQSAAVELLQEKLPRPPNIPMPVGRTWQPTLRQRAQFGRYLRYVQRPESVLEDLEAGTLRPEGHEVMRRVYPEDLERIASAIDVAIAKRIGEGGTFTRRFARQVATLTGRPLPKMYSPAIVAMAQGLISGERPRQKTKQPRLSISGQYATQLEAVKRRKA